MKRHSKKTILSILLILSMLVTIAPNALIAEPMAPVVNELNGQADPGALPDEDTTVPKASDVEHEHNSVGWSLHLGVYHSGTYT